MFFRKKKGGRKKQHKRQFVVFAVPGIAAIGIAGTLIFHYVEAYTARPTAPVEVALDPNIGIEPYVTEFFVDNDAREMLPIIRCESHFRHFENDGTVLKNKEGSSAIGVAQIITSKHPDPKVLRSYNRKYNTDLTTDDFDLTSLQGNLGYALVLYEVRGTRDWECSHKMR